MSERNEERKAQYKKVRADFDDLEIEDKALFLLEATVSTFARGIEELGRNVSDGINDAFGKRAQRKAEDEAPSSGPSATSTEEPLGGTA